MSSFYKMDPADWDFGTAELTLEQEAAYLRVVNSIHKHDSPVPNIDRVLAGMFRCSTRKARALLDALIDAEKLVVEDGRIWNERARSDMVHRQFVSGSASVRGSKGGRTRAENAGKALKLNNPDQATASSRIEENRIEKTIQKVDTFFDVFWASYPSGKRKTDRPKAKAVFKSIISGKNKQIEKTEPEKIIAGIKSYANSKPDPDWVPLPTTWLNGERWNDAAAQSAKTSKYKSYSEGKA